GDDDVESAGVFDHVDRRRVDVHVVYGDVGVRRADLRHDAGPELARVDHDVRLVHEGQLAAATGREFERVLDDAAHAVGGVDAELVGDLVVGALTDHAAVADVRALGALADDDEVDLARILQ